MKKLLKAWDAFILGFSIIFPPFNCFYIFEQKYNKLWDKKLNSLIENTPPIYNEYTISFDEFSVWTSNYPYSFGHLYRVGDEWANSDICRQRSGFLTMLRLQWLKRDLQEISKREKTDEITNFFNNLDDRD